MENLIEPATAPTNLILTMANLFTFIVGLEHAFIGFHLTYC